MKRRHYLGSGTAIACLGAGAAVLLIATASSNLVATSSAHTANAAIVATATTVPSSNSRIEILSQTDTTLAVKFVDAYDDQITLDFTRANTDANWVIISAASPGILFGNINPRYAGAALRRERGITPELALRTFDPNAIVSRPIDDVTIFKTFSGAAIALWQQGAITEIHYVGTWVRELQETAAATLGHLTPCQMNLNHCCNSIPPHSGNGVWPPDLDSCNAIFNDCRLEQKLQACSCLATACNHCPYPHNPDTCSQEDFDLSRDACNAHSNNGCNSLTNPPPNPHQQILDLLQRILDLLQQWIDSQPWN